MRSIPAPLFSALLEMGNVAAEIDPKAGYGRFQPLYLISFHTLTEDEFKRLMVVAKDDYVAAYMLLRTMNLGIVNRGEFMSVLQKDSLNFEQCLSDLRTFLHDFNYKKARRLSTFRKQRHIR